MCSVVVLRTEVSAMSEAQPLPPAAVVVRHQVADFDTWKVAFDGHENARREAGCLGHHINRAKDDPNLVTVYLAVEDVERAKAFAASDDVKQAMEEAGVTSAPELTWATPVREAVVWDRELPAILISHQVADFDSWLAGYNAADDFRQARGIIGHAANRSLDDPSVAMVYHQAESFDTLRAFLEDDELAAAMKGAGVISEPEVSFHTGGWAKFY
jgi:quinol monooxygenase YgiN